MANWGNTSSTSNDTRNVANNFRGIPVTINETGNITSISARIAESTTANEHNWKAEVYDDGGGGNPNHLGSSDVVSNVGTTLGYVTFTFTTPVAVTSGNTYHIVIWSDTGSSNSNIVFDAGSGLDAGGFHQTYPTPPDPWTLQQADARTYAVYASVTTGGGRSADSLTGAFRRGNTGVTVNCTGLDTNPTTQTVTVTDGTHSDTCTITNWNSGDPIINIDCALPPGSYDIQVTDDTGTVTLSGQTLLIETGYEEITYNGSTPPANEESLEAGTIGDYGFTPVANDKWGVTSHANVTWYADGQADINPAGTHTLPYWAWDESTGTMHTGQSIIIGEVPVLTNPALTSTGQNTQQGSADTNVNTGTMYGYWSTSVTPPSSTDLIAGTGAAYHGSLAVTSTGTKTFNATGLVAGATYYAHFLHDNSGSESDISTSAGVATDSGTDITPDQFAFTDQTDVALSAVITSNTITVAGVDAGQNVPLTITNGEYSINGGGWASTPTNVQLGNTIQVRHTSSGSYTTAVNTTLDLNGVSDIFTSTTEANVPPVIDNQSFSILTGASAGSTTGPVVATDTDP
ncbi:MAG: hypothetical protein AB2797_13765, partial [Candidatus Thiodiazotropha sp.]